MTDHSQSTVYVNVATGETTGETITMSDTYRYRFIWVRWCANNH